MPVLPRQLHPVTLSPGPGRLQRRQADSFQAKHPLGSVDFRRTCCHGFGTAGEVVGLAPDPSSVTVRRTAALAFWKGWSAAIALW